MSTMSSLLITNGHLVTLDEANRFIVNGSVYIENNHIIEVKDLVKRFGSFTANDHLNFTVSKGEIFGFLGP